MTVRQMMGRVFIDLETGKDLSSIWRNRLNGYCDLDSGEFGLLAKFTKLPSRERLDVVLNAMREREPGPELSDGEVE